MAQKYLFLSHSGEDTAAARELAHKLREAGLKVWLDVDSQRPGDRWMEVLEQVLRETDAFAVYVGRSGVQRWVDREVRVALVRNTADPSFRIIPILGPSVDRNSLPPFLFQHQPIYLAREGGEPDELKRLVGVILDRKPEEVSLLPMGIPPFRGLDVFDAEHAHLFFGRDREIEELLEKLRLSRFLAVVGDSGSGKSSLVRAGLIPALHKGRFRDGGGPWQVAILRPGNDLFRELADALCDLNPGLSPIERMEVRAKCMRRLRQGVKGFYNCIVDLIPRNTGGLFFIDQFEELFTLTTKAEKRRRFIDSLLYVINAVGTRRFKVLISLRADFYSHCFEHAEFPGYIAENQYAVRRMGRAQLREVIEKPAAMAGAQYQAGLTDVILDDVGDEPGNLPLLEHALLQLWEKRVDQILTHKMYDQIGRLSRAIGKRADEAYERFNEREKRLACRTFLHLTQIGEGTEDTRRRVSKGEVLALDDPAVVQRVLNSLADERLITTGLNAASNEEVVEMAHEALIRSWQRLRDWIDESREILRAHRELSRVVKEWLANDKSDDFLYYGTHLTQTVRWAERYMDELSDDERDFLKAGVRLVVERLLSAETSDVPKMINEMAPLRLWADSILKEMLEEYSANSREKLHISLALLPVVLDQFEYLRKRLLDAELKEALVIGPALCEFREQLIVFFEEVFNNEKEAHTPAQRFRAIITLAHYYVPDDRSGVRWQENAAFIASQLVDNIILNPGLEARLIEALKPINRAIVRALSDIFRTDDDSTRRWFVTRILYEYAETNIEMLADLLMDADPKQFAFLFLKLKELANEPFLIALQGKLKQMSRQSKSEADRIYTRQANAAVALLKMNRDAPVWPLLKDRADPCARSFIIHRAGSLGVDFNILLETFIGKPDEELRRPLLLSFGEYSNEQLLPEQRRGIIPLLLELYQDHPDPGIHGAAEWLLRKWKANEELNRADAEIVTGEAVGSRLWYRTKHGGHTMVIIPEVSGNFIMGSSDSESGRRSNETAHSKPIPRRFAISTKEVTVEQFQQFLNECRGKDHEYSGSYRSVAGGPQIEVTWYQAQEFCEWLSNKEGVEYRLPTEVEWEYACRANARTSRYYGDDLELLGHYAWYSQNSQDQPWPVGSLKPNDFGLFDMLGNLWEWCVDEYSPYENENPHTDEEPQSRGERVIRGGCFISVARWVRSAGRNKYPPSINSPYVGFRLARTLRP